MNSRTRLGIAVLIIFLGLVGSSFLYGSKTFNFEFKNTSLQKIVQQNLEGKNGTFAVYIEQLPATSSAGINPSSEGYYSYLEKESFPAASLYKLVLLAAALKETEEGKMKPTDILMETKTNLTATFGGEDFGYQDSPEKIQYTLEETLERIGRISDNFAAIMLTKKLREKAGEGEEPLLKMAKSLGMDKTTFDGQPSTTASDMATFFKLLYKGQIVSKEASEKIISLLSLSKISDRLPAKLPPEVRVVHKSGELARIRHDAGLVYLENNPYLIVLLSKDLKYEDEGVEVLAQISREVFDFFRDKSH